MTRTPEEYCQHNGAVQFCPLPPFGWIGKDNSPTDISHGLRDGTLMVSYRNKGKKAWHLVTEESFTRRFRLHL